MAGPPGMLEWRSILAASGSLIALLSILTLFAPALFLGLGLALLGTGDWIFMRSRSPDLDFGRLRFRRTRTLGRLGKAVAVIGGILLAEGIVMFLSFIP